MSVYPPIDHNYIRIHKETSQENRMMVQTAIKVMNRVCARLRFKPEFRVLYNSLLDNTPYQVTYPEIKVEIKVSFLPETIEFTLYLYNRDLMDGVELNANRVEYEYRRYLFKVL